MLCTRGRNRRVSPLDLRGLRSLSSGRLQRRPGAGTCVVGSVAVSDRVLISLVRCHERDGRRSTLYMCVRFCHEPLLVRARSARQRRWRRIVLAELLGLQAVEEEVRRSGRGGSGSFFFPIGLCFAKKTPVGILCHRGRSHITLDGSHYRDPRRPCPRLGSMPVPAPRARYEVRACLRRVFTAATDLRHSNEHPVTPFLAPENVVRVNPFQARTCVRGNPVCGQDVQGASLGRRQN